MKRGKSGGYRLIYYLKESNSTNIYLLTIYAKSKKENISTKDIQSLLKELNNESV